MEKYLDLKNAAAVELRKYVSPTATLTETLLAKADKMQFTKDFPPKSRTVKAYHSSLVKYKKAFRAKTAKTFGMSLSSYDTLQGKAKAILADFHTGHSMGCTKALNVGSRVFVRADETHEYAKSCTWRPTYGHVSITLSVTQLRGIEKNADGVWHYNGKALVGQGSKNKFKVVFK